MGESIEVEVVYAERDAQALKTLEVPAGTSVGEALRRSGLVRPETVEQLSVGVFGARCSLDRVLAPGDRVEVYRPLVGDAKVIRRRRARLRQAKAK